MNRTVLLARLWELCERLTDPEDIATLLVAIAVIEAEGPRSSREAQATPSR